MAFIAEEGVGKVEDGSFKVQELECIDIMPNGQFRFGLYNLSGMLKTAGDSMISLAGKPAKCLWCHETALQQSFTPDPFVPGFLSKEEFRAIINQRMGEIQIYRDGLNSDLDFSRTQDHALMERLYISFMEPSAFRLAHEWGLGPEAVHQRLTGLPTHLHPELPFLGDLYKRSAVDPLAPHDALPVPESAREASLFEPDYIN